MGVTGTGVAVGATVGIGVGVAGTGVAVGATVGIGVGVTGTGVAVGATVGASISDEDWLSLQAVPTTTTSTSNIRLKYLIK